MPIEPASSGTSRSSAPSRVHTETSRRSPSATYRRSACSSGKRGERNSPLHHCVPGRDSLGDLAARLDLRPAKLPGLLAFISRSPQRQSAISTPHGPSSVQRKRMRHCALTLNVRGVAGFRKGLLRPLGASGGPALQGSAPRCSSDERRRRSPSVSPCRADAALGLRNGLRAGGTGRKRHAGCESARRRDGSSLDASGRTSP